MDHTAKGSFSLGDKAGNTSPIEPAPTLPEASDELAGLLRQFLDAPAGAGHRPLLSDLSWGLERYERARHPDQGRTGGPPSAADDKIERAAFVLARLSMELRLQATLTVFNKHDLPLEPGEVVATRDVRINLAKKEFSGPAVGALAEFAQSNGLELEFSTEHGATLRLRDDWAERPFSAEIDAE